MMCKRAAADRARTTVKACMDYRRKKPASTIFDLWPGGKEITDLEKTCSEMEADGKEAAEELARLKSKYAAERKVAEQQHGEEMDKLRKEHSENLESQRTGILKGSPGETQC